VRRAQRELGRSATRMLPCNVDDVLSQDAPISASAGHRRGRDGHGGGRDGTATGRAWDWRGGNLWGEWSGSGDTDAAKEDVDVGVDEDAERGRLTDTYCNREYLRVSPALAPVASKTVQHPVVRQ
jgi:hypothetical protein